MADFISSSEAARRLGVTVRRVQELVKSGQLEAKKVSGVWLVDPSSVELRMRTASKSGGRPKRGEGIGESRFTFMNRGHEIADIVYNSKRREFVKIGELIDADRAPIGIAPAGSGVSLLDFNRWWRGRGIPGLHGRGRGDQYVTVKVKVPTSLSSKQKDALRAFAAAMGEVEPEDEDEGGFKSFFKGKKDK